MKIPKSLIINGVKWKIEMAKIDGAEFYWRKHLIRIDRKATDDRKFNMLMHEVIESVTVNNMIRYSKPVSPAENGDFLFVFNHDQFENLCNEICGVIRQFMRGK